MVLDLARLSEPWCFAAGSCFFRSCLTGISSSSRRHQSCEQPQATESLDNLSTMCCFSRISDDTLGSFFAWFWTLLVLQSHGVLLPGAAFFEAVLPASAAAAAATSSASSRRQQNLSTMCCFSRISDDTLGSFLAWFWTLLASEPWCFAAGSCFFRSWFTGISSSSRRHQSCEQP